MDEKAMHQMILLRDRAAKSIAALREPSPVFARVVNTVRQSIADVIEEQQKQIDRYGLALLMIREGAANPRQFAKETLERTPCDALSSPAVGVSGGEVCRCGEPREKCCWPKCYSARG